jgi:hypothetical protein
MPSDLRVDNERIQELDRPVIDWSSEGTGSSMK